MDKIVIVLIAVVGCYFCCYFSSCMAAGGYYGYLSNIAACFGTPPDDEDCAPIPWMGAGSMAGMMGLPGMIDAECIANSDDSEWGAGKVTAIREGGDEKKYTRKTICGAIKEILDEGGDE